jgi:broad specificity phosphatase PhoE
MNPIPSNQLREISCGFVDGSRLADLQRTHPGLLERNLLQNDDRFRWPGGESYREFRCRVLRGVRSILARHRGGRILVFTHAGVISQLIGFLNRTNPAKWEAFRPGSASITEMIWRTRGPELVRFNDVWLEMDQPIACI